MEVKSGKNLPESVTMAEFMKLSGTTMTTIRAFVRVGILTPGNDVQKERSDREYRTSQLWKARYAINMKRQHPNWMWEDIARGFTAMDPDLIRSKY